MEPAEHGAVLALQRGLHYLDDELKWHRGQIETWREQTARSEAQVLELERQRNQVVHVLAGMGVDTDAQ